MTDTSHQSPAPAAGAEMRPAFIVFLLFLSCLILLVAVVANFNMGNSQFQAEMADHWPDYQPDNPAAAAAPPAARLEKTYNEIARKLDGVCVKIAGGRAVNGALEPVHGSGIVVAGRYVLSNYHLVENATSLNVTVFAPAPAVYPARIVMADRADDLALMEVATSAALPSASLGNSDSVNTGDMVFAMGNAFGSGNVFTAGVVSDKRRSFSVGGRAYRDMIQTETYVPPGSCGGPLANIDGEIIGVNTAVSDPQGRPAGIGFATPINRALSLLQNANAADVNGPGAPVVPAASGAAAYPV